MIRDRLNAINAETEHLWATQNLAPQLICEAWTADEFGFVISEAYHDCNDMDGPHWPTVARKVAEAIGMRLEAGR